MVWNLKLKDYGYDGLQAPTDLANLGLETDKYVRSIQPLPGNRLLVVTETGVFLYDTRTATLINQHLLTTREIPDINLSTFAELGNNWASEMSSIPFPHVNVNMIGDGRTRFNPHGFLVVRRRPDITVTNEKRFETPSAGDVIYHRWAIHFDPLDLSAAGPVVGEFHWKASYSPSGSRIKLDPEVTFIDGCSTSAFLWEHQDGYNPSDIFRSDAYSTDKQSFDRCGPNRFWDSYAAFRILITVNDTFFREITDDSRDVTGVDRSATAPPIPLTKTAYLFYANAGCRNIETDPPMKLVRIHYAGSLADVANPLRDWQYSGGMTGSNFLHTVQYEKLPIGIPYRYDRVTYPTDVPESIRSQLATKNFMYSNLYPEQVSGGTGRDLDWQRATQATPMSEYMNRHGEWHEQIWHTFDKNDAAPAFCQFIHLPLSPGSRLGLNGSDGNLNWGGPSFTLWNSTKRTDLAGTVTNKVLEVIPTGTSWVPGWVFSIETDLRMWSNQPQAPLQRITGIPNPDNAANISLFREFLLAIRAFAQAPKDTSKTSYRPYIEPNSALMDPYAAPAAPVVTPDVNPGLMNGEYQYVTTYYDAEKESLPSAMVNAIVVNQLNIVVDPATGPAGTLGRNIYRRVVGFGGADYYYVATLPNNTPSTTYTYIDTDPTPLSFDVPTPPVRIGTSSLTPPRLTVNSIRHWETDGRVQIFTASDDGTTFHQQVIHTDLTQIAPYKPNGSRSFTIDPTNAGGV